MYGRGGRGGAPSGPAPCGPAPCGPAPACSAPVATGCRPVCGPAPCAPALCGLVQSAPLLRTSSGLCHRPLLSVCVSEARTESVRHACEQSAQNRAETGSAVQSRGCYSPGVGGRVAVEVRMRVRMRVRVRVRAWHGERWCGGRWRTVLVERHEHLARAKRALTAAARASAEGRDRLFDVVGGARAEELAESAVQGGRRRLRRQLEDL